MTLEAAHTIDGRLAEDVGMLSVAPWASHLEIDYVGLASGPIYYAAGRRAWAAEVWRRCVRIIRPRVLLRTSLPSERFGSYASVFVDVEIGAGPARWRAGCVAHFLAFLGADAADGAVAQALDAVGRFAVSHVGGLGDGLLDAVELDGDRLAVVAFGSVDAAVAQTWEMIKTMNPRS